MELKLLRKTEPMELTVLVGSSMKGMVPRLLRGLEAESVEIQRQAIEGLGSIGPDAKDAVELLQHQRAKDPEQLGDLIDWALEQIDPTRK